MTIFDRLADRLATDPLFMAYHLRRAAEARGVELSALLTSLGIEGEAQTSLQLCRMPREGREAEDLRRVCERFGGTVEGLGAVLGQQPGTA